MFTITHCPVCAEPVHPRFTVDVGGEAMSVRFCARCGSYVKSPYYDARELQELYSAYDHHVCEYAVPPGEIDSLDDKVRRIERFVPARGRMLEIGCGRGYFLRQALQRGSDARGIELEGSARDHLLPGIDGRVSFIRSEEGFAEVDTGRYDVVCSYQVFEHLLNPVESLRHWIRALKPEGILVLDTPDAGSFGARFHREKWTHHTRREHFILFSRGALGRLFRENGLEIVHVHYGGPPAVCSGAAMPGPPARRIFRFPSLTRWVRAVIHRFELGDHVEMIVRKR